MLAKRREFWQFVGGVIRRAAALGSAADRGRADRLFPRRQAACASPVIRRTRKDLAASITQSPENKSDVSFTLGRTSRKDQEWGIERDHPRVMYRLPRRSTRHSTSGKMQANIFTRIRRLLTFAKSCGSS